MINDTQVSLAALAILATAVAGMVWIVKYILREVKGSLDSHVIAAEKIAKSTDANTRATLVATEVSRELQQFMVNLNGKLGEVVSQKIKEQTVEHQTVRHEDVMQKGTK